MSDAQEQRAAPPMHARDRRLYVALAWSAIPASLSASAAIALATGQLGLWPAVGGVVAGIVAMAVVSFYALEKKSPRSGIRGR
jgi:hypothetical protein